MKKRLFVTFDLPLEVRLILDASFHVSYAAAHCSASVARDQRPRVSIADERL